MMKRRKEFIGVRTIEAANVDGANLNNMYLTDTEIIRCRDCKFYEEREAAYCRRWCLGYWDEDQEADILQCAIVNRDGFCSWAERDE